MLYLLSEEKGYSTPLYMTFMQAKEAGASIIKGEKSFPVIILELFSKGQEREQDKHRRLSESIRGRKEGI